MNSLDISRAFSTPPLTWCYTADAIALLRMREGEEYGIHSSTPLVDVNLYDNQGMTALHYAASCGFLHMCELLLEEHADPNIPKQNNGLSALHFACENGHVNIAKLLVKQKAGGCKHTCMHGMLVISVCICQ